MAGRVIRPDYDVRLRMIYVNVEKAVKMRVTEKLLLQNNQKKIKKPDDFENEETMTYGVRRKKQDINDLKGGIFHTSMKEGINTGKSIFDSQTTFRTDVKIQGRQG